MAKRKPSFEDALQQLETVADRIEQGKIGLEESINEYEQGMALVKQCRAILAKAELKIEQLQQRSDGTPETTAFNRGQGDSGEE